MVYRLVVTEYADELSNKNRRVGFKYLIFGNIFHISGEHGGVTYGNTFWRGLLS